MRMAIARSLLAITTAILGACAPDAVSEERAPLVQRIPAAVSAEAAWALFDRSIERGFVPSPAGPVIATLDEPAELAAVKVYGPAPYRLIVTGPAGSSLGFAPIDLSGLSRGWHAFPAEGPSRTAAVELHFTAASGDGERAVPELELWGSADGSRQRITSLAAESLPSPYSATRALSRVEIEPGTCAAFAVVLERRPELFRRAFITYQASGVLRGSGLRRSVNGLGDHGGSVRCVECKSSPTAPLTQGQRVAHPQIEAQGATIVGRGKPSAPGGTAIPPTRVEIRRPSDQ